MVDARLKLGKYEACLMVEGQEVEHYGIDVNEETKVVSCWIESMVGKHFSLRVSKQHTEFACAFDVDFDGSHVRRAHFPRQNFHRSIERIFTGPTSARPFIFGLLNVTDDDSLLNAGSSNESLGEIKIRLYKSTNVERKLVANRNRDVMEIGKVHEREKKALTHRAMFGQEIMPNQEAIHLDTALGEQVATFIFRYRSLDILKANGIAPRANPTPAGVRTRIAPDSPIPKLAGLTLGKRKVRVKEEEREDEIDSEDEEDKRKEAALEAELKRIKRARLARKVKRAKKTKQEQKPVFLHGEVIDLTID